MKREYDSDKPPQEIKARLRERTRPYHNVLLWGDSDIWLLKEQKDGRVTIMEESTARFSVSADLRIMPTAQGSHITVDMWSDWPFWCGFGVMVPVLLLKAQTGLSGTLLGILWGLHFGLDVPLRSKKKQKELLSLIERAIEM